MAVNPIDMIIDLNDNPGTDYIQGLSVGNFQTPGAWTSMGVGVGSPRPYTFDGVINTAVNVVTVTMNANGYVPIASNFITNPVSAIANNLLELNVPRCISISAPEATTNSFATVSGYEFYNRKMTTQGSLATSIGGDPSILRPYRSITAIYIESDVFPLTVTVTVKGYYDFPFTNQGENVRLISMSDATRPNLYLFAQSATPYETQFSLGTDGRPDSPNPANPVTLTSNLLRPRLNLEANPDDVTFPLTVWMAVSGAGWSFNSNPITSTDPFPNDITKVIGEEPYSVGWVDWQG